MSAALQIDPDTEVALRMAGGKPLRVRGELLAEASSRRDGAQAWHEISIYRCAEGGFAASLRLRGHSCAQQETDRAARFAGMAELAAWLEQFDPAMDLHAGFDVADPAVSGVVLAVKAAALRDRSEDLCRGYRALVGELLYRLETEL